MTCWTGMWCWISSTWTGSVSTPTCRSCRPVPRWWRSSPGTWGSRSPRQAPAHQPLRTHRRRHPHRRLLHQGLQPAAGPAHRREPVQAPPDLRAALSAITRHVDDYPNRARLPRAARNLTQASTSSRPKIVKRHERVIISAQAAHPAGAAGSHLPRLPLSNSRRPYQDCLRRR